MSVCIIGAGSSGIVASKILHDRGIDHVCYETGPGIGGNWRINNQNKLSAAYSSLHINTSKQLMAYSDYPMPDHYPDFPRHGLILDYFESYVDHFGIRRRIQFNTSVESVERSGEQWRVSLSDGSDRLFSSVLVANGHHWCKKWPSFQGDFEGEVMHAHDYRVPNIGVGKRVVLVGIGNSAVDIACELSRSADNVTLSTRRSAYVLPKYVFSRPIDHYLSPLSSFMPRPMQSLMFRTLVALVQGRQEDYGVPKPAHEFMAEHPTISAELLSRVGAGDIAIKPNIDRLDGKRIRFVDGTSVEADLLIYCTGYKISFPFLDPNLMGAENNRVPLYRFVAHPDLQGLYFIGLVQPLGAIMPISELQSRWIADLIEGRSALPHRDKMLAAIEATQTEMAARYVESPRHTIQVDYYPYMRSLQWERMTGRLRKLF